MGIKPRSDSEVLQVSVVPMKVKIASGDRPYLNVYRLMRPGIEPQPPRLQAKALTTSLEVSVNLEVKSVFGTS